MAFSVEEMTQRLVEAGNGLRGFSSQQTEELLQRLDNVESLLAEIEQAPPAPLQDALLPSMQALIRPDLMNHGDIGVKASVTACLTEIMRISAPDLPYNDENLKEIFQLTIGLLDQLSLSEGRTLQKAVSVLIIISRIRAVLVLLDLESYQLVLEMFGLFLKHIRSDHPEGVFPSMEAIMTMVLKESDTIPSELLSLVLSSVRKENQETLPMAFTLGEKVITKCADTLKRHIVDAVKKGDINLDDYTELVSSIYTSGSNSPEENVADDAPKENSEEKEPEKDEGPSKSDETDTCPGKAGQANAPHGLLIRRPNGKPDSAGIAEAVSSLPIDLDESETEPDSAPRKSGLKRKSSENPDESRPKKAESGGASELNVSVPKQRGAKRRHLKSSEQTPSGRADSRVAADGVSEPVPEKSGQKPNLLVTLKTGRTEKVESVSLQKRGRRPNSLMNPDEGYDHSLISCSRGTPRLARQGKDATPSTLENVTENPGPANAITQLRRRQQNTKASRSCEINTKTRRTLKSTMPSDQAEKSTPESTALRWKQDSETIDRAEESPMEWRRSTRLGAGTEMATDVAAVSETEAPQKKSEAELAVKSEALDVNENSSDLRSSRRRKRRDSENKNISSNGDRKDSETIIKRRRVIRKEAASESPDLGNGLAGTRIKVWWPLDKKFYDGVVQSYDSVKQKHVIYYDDGDQETLYLKEEKWEVLGSDSLPTEGQKIDFAEQDDEMLGKLKAKRNQKKLAKEAKIDSSSESNLQKGFRRPRSAPGRRMTKSNQAEEPKAARSSGRSQSRKNQKAKSVPEINVKQEKADSSSLESYHEKGTEEIKSDKSKPEKTESSLERIEMPAVESNVKAKSLDTAPSGKIEEKDEATDGAATVEGQKVNGAMSVVDYSEDASKDTKETADESIEKSNGSVKIKTLSIINSDPKKKAGRPATKSKK